MGPEETFCSQPGLFQQTLVSVSSPSPNHLTICFLKHSSHGCTLLLNNHKCIPSVGKKKKKKKNQNNNNKNPSTPIQDTHKNSKTTINQPNQKILQSLQVDFQDLLVWGVTYLSKLLFLPSMIPPFPAFCLYSDQLLGLPFSISSTHPSLCYLECSSNPQEAVLSSLP